MTRTTTRTRRLAVTAVAPLALCITLAACSSSDAGGDSSGSASAEPQTITFTYVQANPTETYYETLAKDFEAANPGVKVTTNKIALTAADQTIPTQLQAGNGPDVFWTNAGSGTADSVGPDPRSHADGGDADDDGAEIVLPGRATRGRRRHLHPTDGSAA